MGGVIDQFNRNAQIESSSDAMKMNNLDAEDANLKRDDHRID